MIIMKEDERDVHLELKKFIAGASQTKQLNSVELTRTALYLLKSLPSAREAVLEYLNILFDQSVDRHLLHSKDNEYNEPILTEIQSILNTLVSSNSEAWAPLISSWSLSLLGQISSRFQNRIGKANNLNESLQIWMACTPARTLININTQCLTCLIHSNTETCINALLDTSVEHSPHFDWVVAHVGSCFPHTVITRVLTCGLKDYCLNEQGSKAPKLTSVVGILDHLAGSHFIDIKKAILNLFRWSLEDNLPGEDRSIILQKTITSPFLLHLASMSSMLHKALCTDVLPSLNLEMLKSLSHLTPEWSIYLNGKQGLMSLGVHLAIQCEEGAQYIVQLILDASRGDRFLCSTTKEFIETLLKNMEQSMRSSTEPIKFLQSLENNIFYLLKNIQFEDEFIHSIIIRLLLLIGRQNNAANVIILEHALLFCDLEDLVILISDTRATLPLSNAIGLAILRLDITSVDNHNVVPSKFWNNLFQLLRWELAGKEVGKPVVRAVSHNLTVLTEELEKCIVPEDAEKIATLINNTLQQMTTHAQLDQCLKISRAVICFFYTLLYKEKDAKRQVIVCCSLRQLLSTVCSASSPARTLALRELISAALVSSHAILFGTKQKVENQMKEEPSLLEENMKQVVGVMSHSSVFHAGVIGTGPRFSNMKNSYSEDQVDRHVSLLLSLLTEICKGEAMGLALFLVELISPDVMYNGLPWLEEDFCKVTIERDLHIKSIFDSSPICWTLLQFVASHRPALCTCSVLLRAVTASLLGQWNISRQRRQGPGHDRELIKCTVNLLETMALGQLLPPPLSHLYLLIPHITPNHVVMLLRECVWTYMRDHVPSPALFTRDANGISWRDPALSLPPPLYTDTMRFIMRKNMSKFGSLYRLLFSHIHMDSV